MIEQKGIQEYMDDNVRLDGERAHNDEQIAAILGERSITAPATIRSRTNISDSVKGVRTVESTVEITGDLANFSPSTIAELVEQYREAVDLIWPPPPLTDKDVLAKKEAANIAAMNLMEKQEINPEDLGTA